MGDGHMKGWKPEWSLPCPPAPKAPVPRQVWGAIPFWTECLLPSLLLHPVWHTAGACQWFLCWAWSSQVGHSCVLQLSSSAWGPGALGCAVVSYSLWVSFPDCHLPLELSPDVEQGYSPAMFEGRPWLPQHPGCGVLGSWIVQAELSAHPSGTASCWECLPSNPPKMVVVLSWLA